ncbi:MAG: nucleoside recognition protein [Clostridia bacterium]|nr:nucleoside recognition protein [Clostridia bacterium]
MNRIFCVMLLAGVLAAVWSGNLGGAQAAMLSGGSEAVSFCLSMAGVYAFFGGLLGVLRESGVTLAMARVMRAPMQRLFCFAPGEEKALDDICVNLSADLLGMGGAATSAGLAAMRTMAKAHRPDEPPSDAMLLFLTLNMCSVQLLPTTMIALRAAAGAQNPADITLPTLTATGISCAVAVILCKMIAAGRKRRA